MQLSEELEPVGIQTKNLCVEICALSLDDRVEEEGRRLKYYGRILLMRMLVILWRQREGKISLLVRFYFLVLRIAFSGSLSCRKKRFGDRSGLHKLDHVQQSDQQIETN